MSDFLPIDLDCPKRRERRLALDALDDARAALDALIDCGGWTKEDARPLLDEIRVAKERAALAAAALWVASRSL